MASNVNPIPPFRRVQIGKPTSARDQSHFWYNTLPVEEITKPEPARLSGRRCSPNP